MSLVLGLSRQCIARTTARRAIPPSRMTLSCVPRRTLFGVGDPITYATLSACKTLIWSVIGLNGAVFGAWFWSSKASTSRNINTRPSTQQRVQKALNDNFILRVNDIQRGKWWTTVTSAFSHIAPYHIMGNMFALHAFASVLMYSGVPPVALGVLMLGSAVSGSIAYMGHEKTQGTGNNNMFNGQRSALGASGMVMGLGASAAMLAPTTTMLLFGVVPVPMWALFAGYTFYDAYYLDNPMSRVGHAAHLGGGVFGAIFYALVLRRLGGIL